MKVLTILFFIFASSQTGATLIDPINTDDTMCNMVTLVANNHPKQFKMCERELVQLESLMDLQCIEGMLHYVSKKNPTLKIKRTHFNNSCHAA